MLKNAQMPKLLSHFIFQGVWASEVEIADKPVLGNWNISVDVNGQVFTKTFQVAEYILPKFQVMEVFGQLVVLKTDQTQQTNKIS